MTLKEKYESVVDEYVKRFEKKHDLQLEFWVADDKTGVASFGDVYCFNVGYIIYDINNDLPNNLIIKWVEDGIDYYKKKNQMINLHSYAKGLRYQDLPDVPVLPKTEPGLVQFILMNASKLSKEQFASMMEKLKEWEKGIKINGK